MKEKLRRILVVIAIAAAVIFVGVVASVFVMSINNGKSTRKSTKPYGFSCISTGKPGPAHMRCIESDNPDCMGYYKLLGSNPEQGIETTEYRNTCEGFEVPPEQMKYYDRNGKFMY